MPCVHEQRTLARRDHILDRMRDVEERTAFGAHGVDARKALGLEGYVTYRQRLIDQQDVGDNAVATAKATRICIPLE